MERQDWPTAWLFTDERIDADLGAAIARAADAGAGIVVRHHRSPRERRRAIAKEVQATGAFLAIARDAALAAEFGAALLHNPEQPNPPMPFSLSVHDRAQAKDAAARRPALIFISPVHPTRSHDDAAPLGEESALDLMRLARCPAIALGGMDGNRGRALMERGFYGWAGIDCWVRT